MHESSTNSDSPIENIFHFGRLGSKIHQTILQEFQDRYGDVAITFYNFDHPSTQPGQLDLSSITVIHDHEFDVNRPDSPDIDFLRALESRYEQETLWRCLAADRKLVKQGVLGVFHDDSSPYSHRELLAHLEARARPLEDQFSDTEFDFVYGQQIMRVGGMLAHTMARGRGIPFFRVGTSRVADRFLVQTGVTEGNPHFLDEFQHRRDSPSEEDQAAAGLMEKVRDGGELYWIPEPGELGEEGEESSTPLPLRVYGALRHFSQEPASLISPPYYYATPNAKIWVESVKKRVRHALFHAIRPFDSFDSGKSYVYLPLQAQPELSLMIWSRYYTDFNTIARQVAQSVPVGMEVYVNEHPEMYGARPLRFYEDLKRLPNVRVLAPEVETSKVISNADAVVTATSTVGLEALIQGIPTVVLGRPGYSIMDTVQGPMSPEQLSLVLPDIVEQRVDLREVQDYVATALEVGIPRGATDFPSSVVDSIEELLGIMSDSETRPGGMETRQKYSEERVGRGVGG